MAESYAERIKARKTRRRRLKIAFFLLLASAALGGAAYGIKEGSVFRINRIIIRGLDLEERAVFLRTLEPLVLRNAFARFLGSSHYLAWPSSLQPPAPSFAKLDIEKNLLAHTLTLTVEKRVRYGILCSMSAAGERANCSWFDERDGVLFEEAPQTAGQLIPSIVETSETPLPLGMPFIAPGPFQFIKTILATLAEEGISFRGLELDREAEEFRVSTPRDTLLIFSIRASPFQALTALAALRKESSLDRFTYIDLTIPHKLLLRRR